MDSIAKLKEALHLRMHGNPDEYYEESVWKIEVDAICEGVVKLTLGDPIFSFHILA